MQKKHGKILFALTVLLLLTLACSLTTCVNADLTWTIETVDSTENAGFFSSIALDSAGNPHISYHDIIKGDLKYAKWTGASWAIETVDSTERIGLQTSLVLDSSNNPHISYLNYLNYDTAYLKYAKGTQPTPTPEGSLDILPLVAIGGVVAAIVVAGIAVYYFKFRKSAATSKPKN
ncbi:MAG: hypothetical protein IAX22_00480 [Candidatus Bathyarchaeota archaeon]|nr:hypothetical protein [Candidatus Bathyarchaeota archaeon]